jgi:hypothetical protein
MLMQVEKIRLAASYPQLFKQFAASLWTGHFKEIRGPGQNFSGH